MIKANELRINNILNYTTAENDILQTTLDWQDIKWISEDPKGFNLVHEPIPLTEEWLLNFGFEKSEELFRLDKYWVEFRNFDSCGMMVLFGCFQFKKIYITKSVDTIKYVHQLQNLYFALTGQELELK